MNLLLAALVMPLSNSTTEGADSESSEPDLAAVCTVNWCPKVQPKQLYSEYRVACTFICLDATEKGDQAVWLPMVTGWDTMSTVNVIVQDRVLSSWKWISKGGWVTGVGGKRHQVLGTVEVPSQKMTYMGEAFEASCSLCGSRFASQCSDADRIGHYSA
jgi:hypothetical protein